VDYIVKIEVFALPLVLHCYYLSLVEMEYGFEFVIEEGVELVEVA